MPKTILKAEERKIEGRKVKNLRKEGILPGNVYGKKIKSLAVQVDLKEFTKTFKEIGETGLLTIQIGTDEKPVLIHNLQKNPKSDELIHVDFLQVDLKVKVEADIPVELIGESPAEKQGIGTVVQYLNEVKVEALPTDLPESFEVDTSILSEVDQSIMVKSKVEIKSDLEEMVAKVEPPQKEEVVEAPVAPVEGEAPADGETAGEETAEGESAQGEASKE
jgi:large subunit ribosomal protein L25